VVCGGWVGLACGAVAYLAPGDLLTDAVVDAIEDRDCDLELQEASSDACRVTASGEVTA